jgi:enoyl-CoA hydratase/carnithine racemase
MHRIVLSAPGKNALSIAVLEKVRADVEAARGEPFVLTGAGDAFCAGLNLKELATLDRAGMRRLLAALDGAMGAIFHHPAPTAAAVNGHAIAGGCVLALCCDLVVATADPRVRIGLNETAIGLPLPPSVAALVRHRVSPGAWERVVLGAGLHGPPEALALGLVEALADDPLAAAEAEVARLAGHPRAAYALNKRLLREGALSAPGWERALEAEILPAWDSDEVRARARALLGGR